MNFEFVRHICAHGNELPAGPPPFYTGPRGPRSGNHSRTGKLMRTLFIHIDTYVSVCICLLAIVCHVCVCL